MRSTAASNLGPRLAISAVLIAASIALVGCSTVTTLPSPAANTPTETPSTSAGYVYKDAVAGYAVTFPGEPNVEPLAIEGTDRIAKLAGYGDLTTIAFISRGEVRDSPANLRDELFGWLNSVETSGQIGASSYELDGLPALQAEFTMAGGQEAATIVAGDGNTFYQLIAMGGTKGGRQACFDSFSRTAS